MTRSINLFIAKELGYIVYELSDGSLVEHVDDVAYDEMPPFTFDIFINSNDCYDAMIHLMQKYKWWVVPEYDNVTVGYNIEMPAFPNEKRFLLEEYVDTCEEAVEAAYKAIKERK